MRFRRFVVCRHLTVVRNADEDRDTVPPAFDLSKTPKLKDIEFHSGSISIKWIIETLPAATWNPATDRDSSTQLTFRRNGGNGVGNRYFTLIRRCYHFG